MDPLQTNHWRDVTLMASGRNNDVGCVSAVDRANRCRRAQCRVRHCRRTGRQFTAKEPVRVLDRSFAATEWPTINTWL
jgi:hypothetical protein